MPSSNFNHQYSAQPFNHGRRGQYQHSDDECVAFVGNLSYFCREKDLYELFSPYSCVKNVRVMYNEDRSRSLMFGFVELSSEYETQAMIELLNGNMFMGRRLKVSPSDRYLQRTQGITNKQLMKNHQLAMQRGAQLHVAFSSCFPVSFVF
jgi:RNA recognition motif-containing protein